MRQLRTWGAALCVAVVLAGEARAGEVRHGEVRHGEVRHGEDTREEAGAPVFVFGNLALVPSVSTNALVGPRVHNAVSLALLYDRIHRLSGLQLTPGVAAVQQGVTGVQLAGVAGAAGASVQGLQLGGLVAASGGEAAGLQLAGLAAVAGGGLRGGQVSALVSASGGRAEGLQLAGLVSGSGNGARGLQLGGLVAGTGGEVWGLQVGGLVAGAGGPVRGAQLSGLVGGTGELEGLQASGLVGGAGRMHGVQLALGGNGTGRGAGLQLAGIANLVQRELSGAQVALVNVGGQVEGLQLGLVNVAARVRGVQLGLVNVAEQVDGAPIGLVSRVRGGPSGLDAWAGELLPVSAAWRTGTTSVHSLLGAGLALLDGVSPAALAGVGVDVPLGERLSLSPDLLYQHALRVREQPGRTAARVLQLRVRLVLALGGGTRAFAGLTANAGQLFVPAPAFLPVLAEVPLGEAPVRLWPGAVVGVSL